MVGIDTLNIALAVLIILACWWFIGLGWRRISYFFHNNYSYFEVSFVVAYFLEQFILIILMTLKPEHATFWVGVFALIVITTAALEKVSMDGRDKKIRNLYAIHRTKAEEAIGLNNKIVEENKTLIRINKKLIDHIHGTKAK
ncbi:MAG TPA: hypothetical protein VJK03_01140 [Candidatus Nanoarchaeia archaeon]|nr:hypothetical protein [Candidatus Nanoarchaeia archaeon]